MTTNAATNYFHSATQSLWFSANPDKAWGEKFFLIYSPAWMLIMALVMVFGIDDHLSDLGFLLLSLLVALPLLLIPAYLQPHNHYLLKWHQSYWFKANLYIFLFSFFGNYFGSEYFFDVLGMVYAYPTITWHLDSGLLGTGQQRVPVIMYILTQAYFITYHTSATVVLRRIRKLGARISNAMWFTLIFAVGYFWAWLETRAMANPLIQENFYYQDMAAMLKYGSIFYACYFIVSFPIFYAIDEDPKNCWSLKDISVYALAASMVVFYLLDCWTLLIGSIG